MTKTDRLGMEVVTETDRLGMEVVTETDRLGTEVVTETYLPGTEVVTETDRLGTEMVTEIDQVADEMVSQSVELEIHNNNVQVNFFPGFCITKISNVSVKFLYAFIPLSDYNMQLIQMSTW